MVEENCYVMGSHIKKVKETGREEVYLQHPSTGESIIVIIHIAKDYLFGVEPIMIIRGFNALAADYINQVLFVENEFDGNPFSFNFAIADDISSDLPSYDVNILWVEMRQTDNADKDKLKDLQQTIQTFSEYIKDCLD